MTHQQRGNDGDAPPLSPNRKVPKYLMLGGDVGGSNARFKLYQYLHEGEIELRRGVMPPGDVVFEKWYRNSDFEGKQFVDIVKQFFADLNAIEDPNVPTAQAKDVQVACLAVAGPVSHNTVTFSNRDWVLDGHQIAQETGIHKVCMVNDFVALGYGLLTLCLKTECITLNNVEPQDEAPMACVGPGTGLGECFLTHDSFDGYMCFESEGGHAEYAPRTDKDIQMLGFMKDKFAAKCSSPNRRVSVERIVSGPGIANVYEFLETQHPEKVDPEFHDKFVAAAHDKKPQLVAENAASCELCDEAMNVFAGAFGSEAGVAGLKWMPFGGLFLTGGLTPKNIDRIKNPDGAFMTAYYDKGRVSPYLLDIPLYAVMVEDLGERGAHWKAVAMIKEMGWDKPSTLARAMSGVQSFTGAVRGLVTGAPPVTKSAKKKKDKDWRPYLPYIAAAATLGSAVGATVGVVVGRSSRR